MNKCLTSSLILGAFLVSYGATHSANAKDFTPTRGADAAYTVSEVTDSQKIADGKYDFKYYTGLDSEQKPLYKYYNWALNDSKIAPNTIVNLTKVDSCTEGSTVSGGCFKIARGADNSGEPVYEYYTFSIKAGVSPVTTTATSVAQVEANNGRPYVGIEYVSSSASGGAIYNYDGTITTLTGDFIGNHTSGYYAFAGAIDNSSGTIGTLTGDFIGNYTAGPSNTSGGAIDNRYGTITTLTGDFIGNYASATGSPSYARGGAIYNENGTITTLTGDFIGNYTADSSNASGGAIYNQASWIGSEYVGGTIGTLTGDFIGNYAAGSSNASGGAIHNQASWNGSEYVGGTIGTLTGDFIGNYASSSSSSAYGGAIHNHDGGTITTLTGDFIGNYASGNYAEGGAIYNYGTITTLTGDFIGNYASGSSEAYGGAIYNGGTITLVADASNDPTNKFEHDILFQGNYVGDQDGKRYEAIRNYGTINFESRNNGSFTFYDEIDNNSDINLTGDGNVGEFNMYNHILARGSINIQNPYTFNMINGEANTISQDYFDININAPSTLNLDVVLSNLESDKFTIRREITGAENFSLDKINLLDDLPAIDDAEYAQFKINYANATLTGNPFTREQSTSGGRYSITNDGKSLLIAKAGGTPGYASYLADINQEGAERTYSFTKDEDMKHVIVASKDVTGEVEHKESKLTIFGNGHTLNYLSGEKSKAMNLKAEQAAEIQNLTINGFETGLINNGSLTLNGVTLKDNKIALENKGELLFKGENAIIGGENAMYATSKIAAEFPLFATVVDSEWMFAYAQQMQISSYEEFVEKWPEVVEEQLIPTMPPEMAEILENAGMSVEDLYDFSKFPKFMAYILAAEGGIPVTAETTEFDIVSTVLEQQGVSITHDDYDNFLVAMKETAEDKGSAEAFFLLMNAVQGDVHYSYDAMINSAFIRDITGGQSPFSEEELASMSKDELIDAYIEWALDQMPEDERSQITPEEIAQVKEMMGSEYDNMRQSAENEVEEMRTAYEQYAIPSPAEKFITEPGDSTWNFAENAVLDLNTKISGEDVYKLTFTGANDAKINLNTTIENADLVLDGPIMKIYDESSNLASVNSFEVKSGTLDMQNSIVRALVAPNFKVSGNLNLYVDVDLASKTMDTLGAVELTEDGRIIISSIRLLSDGNVGTTMVPFAAPDYKDKVSTTVTTTLYANHEYTVAYNEETGEFVFTRAAEPEPTPSDEGAAKRNASAVAMAQAMVEGVASQVLNRDITTLVGLNSGDAERLSTWVQTFGSDDDVELKNLPGEIDTEFYGVIGGVDSKKFTYGNGTQAVYGVYGAYTRSKQKYDGNKITQNGGYLGASVTFRKDNVFNNITLNGGYLENEANTEFGKDKFDTKVISVANKTGVDIEKGDWTLTPALYLSYMGIDTEDYTTKSGVKVENKFMNVFTIAPELKVAKDFGEGLDGYAKLSYRMFFYDNNKVKADGVLLPDMSSKPYVEYGVGLKKDWSKSEWNAHDVTSYAEITRHDGGREGWDVNLGLKLDF